MKQKKLKMKVGDFAIVIDIWCNKFQIGEIVEIRRKKDMLYKCTNGYFTQVMQDYELHQIKL